MALPTFVGVGPGRSGTSWLYEMLDAHPGVAMARGTKETEFFTREYHRGREWYERFFDPACAVRGEISQRYVFDARVADRIAQLVPDARIVVTLRAPIDRMVSVYNYRRRVGTYRGNFAETVREDGSLLKENRYDVLLAPYYATFPRSQILLCLYDDLQRSPTAYLQNVLAFIGAPPGHLPANADAIVNPGSVARSTLHASASRIAAATLRNAGLHSLLRYAKRSGPLRRLVLRSDADSAQAKPDIPVELRASIREALRPAVDWAERETGRDLRHWRDCTAAL